MDSMISLEAQLVAGLQIALAALLSMVIGLDRERKQKSAGMRTHMLSGVGACIFTVLSLHAFPFADTSRVAANVVTGIGFLGAGVIIQRKRIVHDLTTAASIWSTAAIGMAVGAGAWLLAIVGTLNIWLILAVMRKLKPSFDDDEDSETASDLMHQMDDSS